MDEPSDIPVPEWVMVKLEWPPLQPLMDLGFEPMVHHNMFGDMWDERREEDPEQAKEDILDTVEPMAAEAMTAYGYALDTDAAPTFYLSKTLADFVTADDIENTVTSIEVEDPDNSDIIHTVSTVNVEFTDDIPLDEEEMDRLDLAPTDTEDK